MKKTLSVVFFATALSILILGSNALAQSDAPKLEVGAQYSLLRLKPRLPTRTAPPKRRVPPKAAATRLNFSA